MLQDKTGQLFDYFEESYSGGGILEEKMILECTTIRIKLIEREN